MDIKTARHVVINQANIEHDDSFLARLKCQEPPVPGQVTTLLLALKVIYEHLKTTDLIERELAYALYQLAYEGGQLYERGKQVHVEWPPLLDADLNRIAIAVAQIFKGMT
ncbi:MAG: Dethiobiotin synthetase [Cyanobacteria bacterium J06642_11]